MLILTGCEEDSQSENADGDGHENMNGTNGFDCPGMDGTYYMVTMPKGECEGQGVTLDDQGTPFQDKGGITFPYAGCTEEVTYNGCSIQLTAECAAMGMTVTISQNFAPGDPNILTGTQTQSGDGFITCKYEIFGSTDKAVVLEHAGLSDDIDLSDISSPGTPNPVNLTAAREECAATVTAEESVCPSGNDPERETDNCVKSWQTYDATGCGNGWRAYINCRTEHAADMNCDDGIISACDVYLNADFKCNSAFASSTGCSVAGNPEIMCTGGLGTYSYGCLGGQAPFDNCVEAVSEGTVPMFCCF